MTRQRAAIGALLVVLLTFAAPLPGADATIDRRSATDAGGGEYFIVFCARAGSATGHAFVAWGAEEPSRAMSVEEAFGFYPVGGRGVLGFVPGEVRNEALGGRMSTLTDRLIVRVDRAMFYETQRQIERWQGQRYDLAGRNCIDFTSAVARELGLRVRRRGPATFPSAFIQDLVAANTGGPSQ